MIGIGEGIKLVQKVFKEIYHQPEWQIDGSQFDVLLKDEDNFSAGTINIRTISTPGHTPACVSYLIEDHLFTGDVLFMPDYGTGRCDFPEGSASDLYQSVHDKLYKLPNETKFHPGHDYQPGGRELMFESTIGESKKLNIQLKETTSKEEFVNFRTSRDATLKAPLLLLPSIQVNVNGGEFPKAEDNGVSYLKIPLTQKGVISDRMEKMPLMGGLLIGFSSSLLLWGIGRISGISGIIGTSLTTKPSENYWRYSWIAGLICGSYLFLIMEPQLFDHEFKFSTIRLIFAGLLVGFGTRLGSGCTSAMEYVVCLDCPCAHLCQ